MKINHPFMTNVKKYCLWVNEILIGMVLLKACSFGGIYNENCGCWVTLNSVKVFDVPFQKIKIKICGCWGF